MEVELLLEFQEGIPLQVFLDEQRVKQVLINLMSNALKFTRKGFIRIVASYDD